MQWPSNNHVELQAILTAIVLMALNSCPTIALLMLGHVDAVLPLYTLEGGLVVALLALAGMGQFRLRAMIPTVLLGLGVAFYWGGWPLGLSLLGSVVLVLLLLGYICCIVAKSFNKLP